MCSLIPFVFLQRYPDRSCSGTMQRGDEIGPSRVCHTPVCVATCRACPGCLATFGHCERVDCDIGRLPGGSGLNVLQGGQLQTTVKICGGTRKNTFGRSTVWRPEGPALAYLDPSFGLGWEIRPLGSVGAGGRGSLGPDMCHGMGRVV